MGSENLGVAGMSKITADEFVHMTMAFADKLAKDAATAHSMGVAPYLQSRDELRAHLIDSAAALQLEAFCDGVAHANKGWAGDEKMPSLSLFNGVCAKDC
jgi:hypothetical protein